MNRNRKKGKPVSEKNNVVKAEEVDVKMVREPKPLCCHCGEPIDAICEAISEGEGNYSHFDCVIKDITERYHVEAPDKVSYIGGGCFAVIGTEPETKKFFIKEKIAYETPEKFNEMKRFVEESKK